MIPALILKEHLVEKFKVIISSDIRGLKYFDKEIFEHVIINTPRLKSLFFTIEFNFDFLFNFKILFFHEKEKIEKIFSIGGYMSLPVILAARLLNLEIYLIEPNQVLGRANKFFLRFCKKIFCYSENIKNFSNNFRDKIITINPLVKKKVYEFDFDNEISKKINSPY